MVCEHARADVFLWDRMSECLESRGLLRRSQSMETELFHKTTRVGLGMVQTSAFPLCTEEAEAGRFCGYVVWCGVVCESLYVCGM